MLPRRLTEVLPVCVCVCVCRVEWSGSSTRLFSVDSLCDPVRLSATALRILELEKVASAQTSVH